LEELAIVMTDSEKYAFRLVLFFGFASMLIRPSVLAALPMIGCWSGIPGATGGMLCLTNGMSETTGTDKDDLSGSFMIF